MDEPLSPAAQILSLKRARSDASDVSLLAELADLEPLPDEADPAWDSDEPWDRTMLLIALAELAAERRLRAAAGLVLDKLCYGDPGESMRGIRHTLEAMVNPEWSALTTVCIDRCTSPRPGTRYWAAHELGVLRDATALPALFALLRDPLFDIAIVALQCCEMTAQDHPGEAGAIAQELRAYAERCPAAREEVDRVLSSL